MTKNEFLEKARSIHGYKYQYQNLSNCIKTNDIITVLYEDKAYKQRVVKHINLGRCPEKNIPKKTTEQFIEECKKIWGNKYDYSLVEYKGSLKKVKIIFDNIVYEQLASSHICGQAPERILTQENFIKKSIKKHGDKYDYSLVKFISGDLPVLIGYNGIFYLQKPYYHLSGSYPENIKLSVRKTVDRFIKEANLIHDFKYNYDKTNYITNQTKIIITCPLHNDFTQRPLAHIQGSGCPNCGESKGEKEISKFLNDNDIFFERQRKFENCKNVHQLPFDFFIPSMNVLIEFDGLQHFQSIAHFGGLETYEKLKINDKIKTDYCEDNYINLIRIRYDQIDDIYKILWNNLSTFIKNKKF